MRLISSNMCNCVNVYVYKSKKKTSEEILLNNATLRFFMSNVIDY